MSVPQPLSGPQDLAEALPELESILDDALRDGRRIGYHAALQARVLRNLRHALLGGELFHDEPRMQRLGAALAARFLGAWADFRRDARPARSWGAAFQLLDNPKPLLVQHLLLGANAQLNLDLAWAAAAAAPDPDALCGLWRDFLALEALLTRVFATVQQELACVSPRLARLAEFAPDLEHPLFDFAVESARDLAWQLAEELVQAPPARRALLLAGRDAAAAQTGRALYPLRGWAREVEHWIRAEESSDVRLGIQVVAG